MSYNYSNNYGLNPNYNYYEFSFDSSQAQRAYNTSYTKEDWPVFFLGGKRDLTNVAAIKILEVQIPFSYYVFNASNIVYTDPLGTRNFSLIGNFTAAQLISKLKTELDAAHVALGGGANAFTVILNPQLNKLNILGFDAGPFVFSLTLSATDAEALGYNTGLNTSDLGGSLQAPKSILVSGPNYLYLNSNMLGSLINLYLPSTDANTGGNAGPQVAKIPVNAAPTGIIYWQDPDPQKWFDVENLSQLQQTDFYLSLGTHTDVLRLQGLPFSIKFGVLLNRENVQDNMKVQDMSVKRLRAF